MVRIAGAFNQFRSFALASVLAVVGCSTQPAHVATAPMASRAAPAGAVASTQGAEVATELTAQYRDTRANCGTSNRPAFLCTGVMFRGTIASTAYHSWNPSPGSQQRGGVSFSFLRADSKFNRLAYGYTNGLIFKPYLSAGTGKLTPEILCVFPVDGWTDGRNARGCGAHIDFPTVSGPCQAQGITTARQWASHFNQPASNKNTHACGFDVSDTGSGQAAYFTEDLAARALIPNESFVQNDELVVATWPQMENPTSLPIQAFFYLPGGLAGAQQDQKDYYTQANAVIPIIAMTLPPVATSDATFVYRQEDQVVGTTSFYINPDPLTLATANPTQGHQASGGTTPYIYSSSKPAVVEVTDAAKGIVQAVTTGEATINVRDSATPAHSGSYPVQAVIAQVGSIHDFSLDPVATVAVGASKDFGIVVVGPVPPPFTVRTDGTALRINASTRDTMRLAYKGTPRPRFVTIEFSGVSGQVEVVTRNDSGGVNEEIAGQGSSTVVIASADGDIVLWFGYNVAGRVSASIRRITYTP